MSYEAHSEEYKGHHIRILHDEHYDGDVNEEDTMFIVTTDSRYFSFTGPKSSGLVTVSDVNEYLSAQEDDDGEYTVASQHDQDEDAGVGYHVFILSAYVHSGIMFRVGPTRGGWDSGNCGFVLVSRSDTNKREQARVWAEGYIEHLNDLMSGNVWGYIVEDEDGDEVGSCWGFVGDWDNDDYGPLTEARSIIDHCVEKEEQRIADLTYRAGGEAALQQVLDDAVLVAKTEEAGDINADGTKAQLQYLNSVKYDVDNLLEAING